MSSSDFARAAGRRKPAAHVWGKPLPGQGRVRICTLCGARDVASSRQSDCRGQMGYRDPDVVHTGELDIHDPYD